MFFKNSKQDVDANVPFISTNSILYSSCSGIRRNLLSREFKYKVSAFEESLKKNKLKNKGNIGVSYTKKKKESTVLYDQEMETWLNKRSQSKVSVFSKLSKPEMLVAGNWFRQQMKAYFSGDSKSRQLVIDEFVRNGFFSNGVEGGRLLARIESKNNGYLNQDDFAKFLHQLAKSNSFNELQFQVIRDFVANLGGSRLAKQLERANKFERATEKLKTLTALTSSLRSKKKKVTTKPSLRLIPESNETIITSVKGGGLMYFSKPRYKPKSSQYTAPQNNVTAEDNRRLSSVCVTDDLKLSSQKGGLDLDDGEILLVCDDKLNEDNERNAIVLKNTKREESLIDTTVELMDHKKQMDTCYLVLSSLTKEKCAKNVNSSAAKKLLFYGEKVVMKNRVAKTKIHPQHSMGLTDY